jgi:hypothetical protein
VQLLSTLIFHLTIKPRLDYLKKLLPEAEIYPCGSRYVCNPPVLSTDVDFLVFSRTELREKLTSMGYRKTSGYYPGANFLSWRKGAINLIVTGNVEEANSFNLATHICKAWNVRDKWNRLIIYEKLRNRPDQILWIYQILWPDDFDKKLEALLVNLTGPYGVALRAAYRAQHGLEKIAL